MSKFKHNLHKELVTEGASQEEAASLAEIANRLKDVPAPKPLLFLRRGWWTWQRVIMAGSLIVLAIFAGGSLVAIAQVSQPDTALYPIKRASETVMVKMDPAFMERVMIRRVTEIDTLVSNQAPADVVLSDVKDYEKAIPDVKLTAADRDYCTDHLNHALSQAGRSERQALQEALAKMSYPR